MSRKHNHIAWVGVWSAGHNNVRYEELLPRLRNVDPYYIRLHGWWPLRGLQRRLLQPALVWLLALRYPLLLCSSVEHIRLFRGRVFVDLDDARFTGAEIAALETPRVCGIAVTQEAVKGRLEAMGLTKPIWVMPQGVAQETISPRRVGALRREWGADNNAIVVGLHQPDFFLRAERPNYLFAEMYVIDRLLEVMEAVHGDDPRVNLWLVGRPSSGVHAFAERHAWVRLVGYREHREVLNYVSAFDLGVYPRDVDVGGLASIKLLEYMACAVPVVGIAVREMEMVRAAGAGCVAATWEEFGREVARLARDPVLRRRLGEKGRAYAAPLSWDRVAEEYMAILDRAA